MGKLSDDIIDRIHELSDLIEYGSITIHLNESTNMIDLEVNERIRMPRNKASIKPGTIVESGVTRN